MNPKFVVFLTLPFAFVLDCHAGSATWSANPSSANWNQAANWEPNTVPNGPADVATFGTSNVTDVSLSADTEISAIVFGSDASAYSIAVNPLFSLTLAGPGLTNSSSQPQTFDVIGNRAGPGWMLFHGNASAGSGTIITAHGGFDLEKAGILEFHNNSSAGSSTLIATHNSDNAYSGTITFFGHSTAGTATITGNGSRAGITFTGSTTADHATISVSAGAQLSFFGHSNAGSANITLGSGGGGVLVFEEDAYAGATASIICYSGIFEMDGTNDMPVELHSPGYIEVGGGNNRHPSVGSLAGDGLALIDNGSTFGVGSNNLNTEFAGSIADDPNTGEAGALNKVGTGSLTLSGSSGYRLGTTVTSGLLVVANTSGSATGDGPVTVEGGILGGRGTITGIVTVGTGSGAGAVLAPGQGASNPTTLTIQNALTFKADGSYTYKVNTNKATADQVIAKGVTIESGAQFDFKTVANKKLTAGKVFIAISNTGATPITGTFSNLVDGSTVTVGVNKLQVSYSGGDGNDLTLTVVP